MTPEEFQARKERSGQRKRKLAQAIDDEAMFVAAIRFYLGALLPTRTAEAEQVHEQTDGMSRKWKRHLTAARRILGLQYKERGRTLRLPANFGERLSRIGLNLLSDFDARQEFFQLNANLVIDEAITDFAFFHPVLLDAKAFLRGDEWSDTERRFKPEPPKLNSYSKCLQHRVMEEISKRFGFGLPASMNVTHLNPP